MDGNIFSLFVGINHYHPSSGVNSLGGCENDVLSFRQWLTDAFPKGKTAPFGLTLLNEYATRENMIGAFREHLAKAGSGDAVLIYYSGHGSYGISSPEFQPYFSGNREENWVLYDSRLPGNFDLADKEIAWLIRTYCAACPHLVIISDSCHSGSVSREPEFATRFRPRNTPAVLRPRPLSSYLNGVFSGAPGQVRDLIFQPKRHALIAACQKSQLAYETNDGKGVFSATLLRILQREADVSYTDLFIQCRAEIEIFHKNQNPQLETVGGFNPNEGFLKRHTSGKKNSLFRVHNEAGKDPRENWTVDLGAAHGLLPEINTPVRIELFKDIDKRHSIGTTMLSRVGLNSSQMNAGNLLLDANNPYWAEALTFPAAPLLVHCPVQIETFRELREKRPLSPVYLREDPAGCRFRAYVDEGAIGIIDMEQNCFVHGIRGTDASSAGYIFSVLEQIAYWRHLAFLQNPKSGIPREKVSLILRLNGLPIASIEEPVQVAYRKVHGIWKGVPIQLELGNTTGFPLYIALLYLTPGFGVKVLFSDNSPLQPNQKVVLLDDELNLPDEALPEETDMLKLIVSTIPVETYPFEREDIDLGVTATGPKGKFKALSAFMKGPVQADWDGLTLEIKIVRQPGL